MFNTIRSIIYMAAAVILLTTAATSFILYSKRPSHPEFTFSDHTIAGIKNDLSNVHDLLGVIIIAADLQTNSRKVVYTYILDNDIDMMFIDYFKYKSVTPNEPLFTRDNIEINQRLIKLINHETVCAPWSSLIGSKFVPDASQKIKMTCAVATPPSYGGFDGTVTILLSKEPSDDEKAYLALILKKISYNVSSEISTVY